MMLGRLMKQPEKVDDVASEVPVSVSTACLGERFTTGETVNGESNLEGSTAPRRLSCRIVGTLASAFLVFGLRVTASGQLALREGSSESSDHVLFHVEVEDAQGSRVAVPMMHADSKSVSVEFDFDREYQPGDRIVFNGPRRMAVRMDDTVPECLIYSPEGSPGNLTYEIPYGRAEQQTGSAYAPETFVGTSHRVRFRSLNKHELSAYRNLALNPCDLPRQQQQPAQFFPHASSNSVSRSLFDFEARNAIDGSSQNGHHGVWPYESWGPQLRTDIWWKLDFGRLVKLDKVRLMVRADYPHDSYWKSAEVEFSDGSRVPLRIEGSAAFQEFHFSARRVSWLRIAQVVPEDASKWCSFIEVEAWGKDLP
jgi:hypothetical protein